MHDADLDRLLSQAGATPAVQQATLDELSEATKHAAQRARSPHRRRFIVIGAATVGTLLLAAATGTAYWAKLPPFQSTPDGIYRTQHAIPVTFTMDNGRHIACQLFPEFLHLNTAQSNDADHLVTGHNWTTLGQSIYDQDIAPATDGDTVTQQLSEPLTARIRSIALQDMPYLASSPLESTTTTGPAWNGWGMSCGDSFR